MFLYTALGDSITFGENASSPAKAYPSVAVSHLNARSYQASAFVLAAPGWTSADLADKMMGRQNPALALHHSNAVSILIGGDDLAFAGMASLSRGNAQETVKRALNEYRRYLSVILKYVKSHSRGKIICCTQYNPFPNSPLAAWGINSLNQAIMDTAQRFQVSIAPVHEWFEGNQGRLIYGYRTGQLTDVMRGSTPIHPNDAGHEAIARGLVPYLIP